LKDTPHFQKATKLAELKTSTAIKTPAGCAIPPKATGTVKGNMLPVELKYSHCGGRSRQQKRPKDGQPMSSWAQFPDVKVGEQEKNDKSNNQSGQSE
jgi:hypothetical protein